MTRSEWSVKNRRRGELIEREEAGTLTLTEESELAELQELADRIVDSFFERAQAHNRPKGGQEHTMQENDNHPTAAELANYQTASQAVREHASGFHCENGPATSELGTTMPLFAWQHLPEHLQEISRPFGELAEAMANALPNNRERTKMLDRLLEAKDAAVRARKLAEVA